jgi:hypothetical protein
MARMLRNKGLGLKVSAPLWRMETPHVEVETRTVGDLVYRRFKTPVGEVSMKEKVGLREGAGASWIVEHPIKGPDDFEVVEFIAEDTVYIPDYGPFRRAEEDLGGDGIVFVWAGRSPIQEMQIELMGYRIFAISMYRYPEKFRSLHRALERRAEKRYGIIAESPAEIVNGTDNINSVITSPRLYREYIIPFYKRQADRLHRRGKILEDHMDGKLRALKKLISETPLDAVEAFTPPPMGDLPLAEALAAWKDKVISLNFPESVILEGPEAVKRQVMQILTEAGRGDRLIITVTEDIPRRHRWTGLSAITETLQRHGAYPLKAKPEAS